MRRGRKRILRAGAARPHLRGRSGIWRICSQPRRRFDMLPWWRMKRSVDLLSIFNQQQHHQVTKAQQLGKVKPPHSYAGPTPAAPSTPSTHPPPDLVPSPRANRPISPERVSRHSCRACGIWKKRNSTMTWTYCGSWKQSKTLLETRTSRWRIARIRLVVDRIRRRARRGLLVGCT